MKKSTKIILSIIGVGVIGAGAYLLIKRFRKPGYVPPVINGTPPPRNNVGGPVSKGDSFPLKQGSRGPRVVALQKYMNIPRNENAVSHEWGFYGCDPKLDTDGIWGPLTEACFKNLRKVYSPEINENFYNKFIKAYE
jgi:hypothetical protein